MFLQRLKERNPALMDAAVRLHQSGRIPPATYVMDLDTIAENARKLAAEASRLGLTTYLMTKQYARNPYVTGVALANGLYKTVAVDMPGALQMRRYGIPVGHMGHLNQVPRHSVPAAVAMRPDVITVYNVEHARWIDQAAGDASVTQDLLIRVYAPDDVFFDGQEGGFPEDQVPDVARTIGEMKNVRLVGVTAFPCVRYNTNPDQPLVEPTPNLATILRAAETLRGMGFEITQINAPGNTSSLTMPILARNGATHVEPGHGLTGTTPPHALIPDLAERPAYTFVSEISHHFGGRAYAFGGGLFRDIYRPGFQSQAFVGSTWETAQNNALEYHADIQQIIDYHAILSPGIRAAVGDTALFGFRAQMQMTRSYIAPVYGISRGEPRLDYLFDSSNTALDADFNPVDPEVVRRKIDEVVGALAAV